MKISRYILLLLVITALAGGYFLRIAFTQPSTRSAFATADSPDAELRPATLTCIVEGVKCKGTANFFASLYQDTPGIISLETFGTEHKAVFTYYPDIIDPEKIKSLMEQPITLRDGSQKQIFRCLSLK